MPNTPLNPDALEVAAKATYDFRNEDYDEQYHDLTYGDKEYEWLSPARVAVSAYLAVAQQEVSSVEELDALPVGSVILDGDPCVLQMVEKSSIVGSEWAIANAEHLYTTGKITLPARVLYRPEVPGA